MPDPKLPIIPRPRNEVGQCAPASGRILNEMVNGALALRQASTALAPSYNIGGIELCEPDYRQILLWSDALAKEPAVVLGTLLDDGSLFGIKRKSFDPALTQTLIKDGRLIQLYWEIDRLPLADFTWVDGLMLESLIFVVPDGEGDAEKHSLALNLPQLRRLKCANMGLDRLDLSQVPLLEVLDCGWNEIPALNLSQTPLLTDLNLNFNPVASLDLRHVPDLTKLCCSFTSVSMLPLSAVPGLEILVCMDAALTTLDLSKVPELKILRCSRNAISTLELSCVPELNELMCDGDNLTSLDLTNVPNLTCLMCRDNPLKELDIRPLTRLQLLDYDDKKTRLLQRPDQQF